MQTISNLLHSYFADQDVVERCEISRCRDPNGRIKRLFTDVRLSDCLLLSMPQNLTGKKNKIKVTFGPVETFMGNVYELVSVVYHIGRSTYNDFKVSSYCCIGDGDGVLSGHYIAAVRCPKGDKSIWFVINDEIVVELGETPPSEKSLLGSFGWKEGSCVPRAYIVGYVKRDSHVV